MQSDLEEMYASALHLVAEALGEPRFARKLWSKEKRVLLDGVQSLSELLYGERNKPERVMERFYAGEIYMKVARTQRQA